MSEQVLVVDAELLDHPLLVSIKTSGFLVDPVEPGPEQLMFTGLLQPHVQLMPRDKVESDPRYVQLIPYVLLQRGDKFLSYRRAGGEPSLRDRRAIGFGGHVNVELPQAPPSVDYEGKLLAELLMEEARREVNEETNGAVGPLRLVGLVYTGGSPQAEMVQRVHLGFVYVMRVPADADVTPKNSVADEQDFTWVDEEVTAANNYEAWSLIAKRLLTERAMRLDLVMSAANRLTAVRLKTSGPTFAAPERDVVTLLMAAFQSVLRRSAQSQWGPLEGLHNDLCILQGVPDANASIAAAESALDRFLQIVTRLEADTTLVGALDAAGWMDVPAASRLALLACIGNFQLASWFCGVRQAYQVGLEPEMAFQTMYPAVARLVAQASQCGNPSAAAMRQRLSDVAVQAVATGLTDEHMIQIVREARSLV